MFVRISKWVNNEVNPRIIELYLVDSVKYMGDYFYVNYATKEGKTTDKYYLGDIESINVYNS